MTFAGWGMRTQTNNPWQTAPDQLGRDLAALHDTLKTSIQSGEFVMSQFRNVKNVAAFMDTFKWREYIVLSSLRLAMRSCPSRASFSMVEAGVCDGWTAWLALSYVSTCGRNGSLWAYDAWTGMRREDLLASEVLNVGNYQYLELDRTKRNLKEFAGQVNFCPGFIPDAFTLYPGPPVVNWLHIDLNSSRPTRATLEHLWDRIPPSGVVLFDDYDWPGFEDTKATVDQFLGAHQQWVFALPTGQGLVIKS